jgi:threonine/homoserine/homoserine lactone efflux protein
MMYAIWTGVLLGITLGLAAGPAMFALVQTSIREGFFRAMIMEIGILLSDAFCIFIALFSIGRFIEEHPEVQLIILASGGVLLIAMGLLRIFARFSPKNFRKAVQAPKASSWYMLLIKGFIYNTINPGVILFWIGVVSIISSKFDGNRTEIGLHFSAVLGTLFLFDASKAWFGHKIKVWMTPRRIIYMGKIVGGLFIVFGIFLIIRFFLEI